MTLQRYVSASADGSGTGSLADPWTIAQMQTNIAADMWIWIKQGAYDVVDVSGKPLLIGANHGSSTVTRNSMTVICGYQSISGDLSHPATRFSDLDGVKLEISNAPVIGNSSGPVQIGGADGYTDNVLIRNCYFYGLQSALVDIGGGCRFQNCRFNNLKSSGAALAVRNINTENQACFFRECYFSGGNAQV
jgi:hypothetical protein